MREILFRGKTAEGDWTYGYYVHTPKRTGAFGQTVSQADVDRHHILTMKCNIIKEIYPETIGQYTGLTDKNGKKIFEGDIVKNSIGTFIVKFLYGTFCCSLIEENYLTELCSIHNQCEVIGNIHDNPELLKGE